MTGQPDGGRPEPLEEFIAELVRLREAAGNPSFREMAARSGAVSHATLHLSVTGNRLQQWETVREFVRACDGDEASLHEHWERANLALAECTDDEHDVERATIRRHGGLWKHQPRGSRGVTIVASAVVVAVAAVVTFTVVGDGPASPSAGQSSSPQAARKSSPGPAIPGDATEFLGDATIPDGTVVRPGEEFLKIWEFRNAGSIRWHDRYLQRTDKHQDSTECRTPRRVPIKDTAPSETVKIRVHVTAPSTAPVNCKVDWKTVDKAGRPLFPSLRPVYFLVRVRK